MVVIVVIVLLAQQQINTVQKQKDVSDTQNSLLDLSSAAKQVYAQGEGSKQLVYIQLPSSYESSRSLVGNKSITIRAGGTDFVALENFNVHGYLPATSGGHWVWVVSEGNRVRIGDAMMEINPNRIYLVMNANTSAATTLTIKAIWSRGINVSTSTSWTASDVSMSGVPGFFYLDANATNIITLQFSASAGSGGVYSGQIELVGSDGQGSMDIEDVPITVQVIPPSTPINATRDTLGPLINNIYQDPTPAIKFKPLAIYVNATDALTGNNTIKGCQIEADGSTNWTSMLPVDGAYNQVSELSIYNYTSGFVLGPHLIGARCTDIFNNTGPIAYYYFNVSEADQLGPIVIQMIHSEYPTTLSNVSVGGVVTDAYTGNSNIQGCIIKLDSGFWYNLTAWDGAWDSPTENFTYNLGAVSVGYHNVYYQCTDVIGNVGGIYNDSFGVVDVDLMIVLDRSGSMAWNVTNVTDNTQKTGGPGGTTWYWVKNVSIAQKNGDLANLTVELWASNSSCTSFYNATINGVQMATGNRTGTTHINITSSMNISNLTPPYTLSLGIKPGSTGCTAYTKYLSIQQLPSKMSAAQTGAKSFLDVAGNNIEAGLASFSTTSTTDKQLALMTPTNQQTLKNSIDALAASGNTCIECGLDSAADELTSARSRPASNKVIIMLTDGVGNTGKSGGSCDISCSVAAAEYCRARNITVYTIGFGDDVNDQELTDIALLTHGDYYFAPNVQTLTAIFQSIGKH